MDSLPLTVCPSQLQLQSTDDQSLQSIEARLYHSCLEAGFITDSPLSDPLPFPTIIPDPAPPSPSPVTEVSTPDPLPHGVPQTLTPPRLQQAPAPAPSKEAPFDADFFADLLSSSFTSSTEPPSLFTLEEDLNTDSAAALLEQWEAANNEQQPAASADASTTYEALFSSSSGAVSVPVAVGQAPATPESSTRKSSDDGLGNPDPLGWGWVPVAAQAPTPGAAPGYMTPPGSGKAAEMAMDMAMEVEMEGIDWEALLATPLPALAPAPAPAPAPVFFPAPALAPLFTPAPTSISPTLTSPTTAPTSVAPSPTKTKASKAKAADRRERKVTRRRRETTKAAPGTFVFAENIVPPPEVYHSAYTHTREYCLDARGKQLRRRRYEDKI